MERGYAPIELALAGDLTKPALERPARWTPLTEALYAWGLTQLPDQIRRHIDPRDGHWIWTGAGAGDTSGIGYGSVRYQCRTWRAHRLVFSLLVEPLRDGLVLDHLRDVCGIPLCVFPCHLEQVTQGENMRRGEGYVGVNARKTHCVHGHEFTPENTRREGNARRCLACIKERNRRTQARIKARREAEG